jgi:uncharacterized protein YcfJ
MKKTLAIAAIALSLGACTAREERAGTGALIGGAAGAVVGGLATGRAGGAVAGGVIGAAGGAIIGSATTPRYHRYHRRCPYGYYRGRSGRLYCR